MSHSASTGSAPGARHGRRIFLIWLPLAIVAAALIRFVWYPHLPPGRMTDQAQGQQFDIAVMAVLAAPVLVFVWVYFAYALIVWRRRPGDGDDEDGVPLHGNTKVQATWITATAVIVLGLFVFGTVQLILPAGAGRPWAGSRGSGRPGRARGRARRRSGPPRRPTASRCRSSGTSGPSPTGSRSSAAWRPRSSSCRWARRSSST